MKEAIIAKGPKVEIIDSPTPKPEAGQVVTKVVFSGSNPKDCSSYKTIQLDQSSGNGLIRCGFNRESTRMDGRLPTHESGR